MTETESTYHQTVAEIAGLSNAELDLKLEDAAVLNEESEMLLCCYLAAVRERRAYEEFGYANLCDYASVRFGFGERKTRYLVALGQKIERLPQIREALASGKLGWCKASRVAVVATPENEAMWLDSALSLTVRELEGRLRDGTDSLASVLHLPLTKDRRVLWEHGLEIYRRRAGSEISPVEAFELMLAEVIAEWGHYLVDSEDAAASEAPEESQEPETAEHGEVETETVPSDEAPEVRSLFPWVEPIDTGELENESSWASELDAEKEFAAKSSYNAVRQVVLERDGWKCTYPGCGARAHLEVHHLRYRSHGGPDEPWNLTVLCHFHHRLLHAKHIDVKGRAPLGLEWTPPKLMRAVLDRRRNKKSFWVGELEVREWSLEGRAAASG